VDKRHRLLTLELSNIFKNERGERKDMSREKVCSTSEEQDIILILCALGTPSAFSALKTLDNFALRLKL